MNKGDQPLSIEDVTFKVIVCDNGWPLLFIVCNPARCASAKVVIC